MKRFLTILAAVSIAALAFPSVSNAGSAAEIKARMAKRLTAINALKAKGLLGENNKGFLEPRGKISDDDAKIVAAENADRKTVYAMLARKLGQSIEIIGTRRAVKIAEKSKTGLWVQSPEGKWMKKK
jgi:uncharacterized protein YdbL (DUF1318 family)